MGTECGTCGNLHNAVSRLPVVPFQNFDYENPKPIKFRGAVGRWSVQHTCPKGHQRITPCLKLKTEKSIQTLQSWMIKTDYLGVFWMVLAGLQHWTLNAWVFVRVHSQWHTQEFIFLAVVKQNLHVCPSTGAAICVHWYQNGFYWEMLLFWGEGQVSLIYVSFSGFQSWEMRKFRSRSQVPWSQWTVLQDWE